MDHRSGTNGRGSSSKIRTEELPPCFNKCSNRRTYRFCPMFCRIICAITLCFERGRRAKLGRVDCEKTEAISEQRDRRFSKIYRSTSLFRVVSTKKSVGSCLRPSWEIPFADEKHGRTGQKEPFYPSTQKGISLTTLSHLLKKTWDDVRADYGRDEDGKREKKVEKREGTRGRDTNSRDRLMLAERKAERKEVLP